LLTNSNVDSHQTVLRQLEGYAKAHAEVTAPNMYAFCVLHHQFPPCSPTFTALATSPPLTPHYHPLLSWYIPTKFYFSENKPLMYPRVSLLVASGANQVVIGVTTTRPALGTVRPPALGAHAPPTDLSHLRAFLPENGMWVDC
jgi:hypothetical protein